MQKIAVRWVLIFIWDISPNNELYLSSCYSCGEKKTHYGVSSFHIVKSSIRLQENMIFSGIKDPELDDDDDYGQAGHSEPSLGSSLFHPTLLKQAFLGQHWQHWQFLELVLLEDDALLWWHVQLFNFLTFYLVADCNKPCTRDCPQVCGSNGKTYCNKCILENVSFSRKWKIK